MRFLILFFAIASCSENKKESIIERQKAINVEIKHMQDSIAASNVINFNHSPSQRSNNPEQEGAIMRPYFQHVSNLKKEYDSLELELKKY